MATPLIPQEIYLLERFCSLERYGQMRDAWKAISWMEEVELGAEGKYYDLQRKAGDLAWPIALTSSGLWGPDALTADYVTTVKEPLNPPPTWPTYRLNRKVTVNSGDRVPQTGIYLPDVDRSFPTLLIKSDDPIEGEANKALIDLPGGGSGYVPATWTLIERVADEIDIPAQPSLVASVRLRAEGGQACPQAGYCGLPRPS